MMLAPSPRNALDEKLSRLRENSGRFARLPIEDRIQLAADIHRGLFEVAEAMVKAACHAKGISPSEPLAGEEWMMGPWVAVRHARLYCKSLKEIRRYGKPRLPARFFRHLPDGRTALRVYPMDLLDATLLPGHRGEVHFQAGISEGDVRARQARFYQSPHSGRVCLVLGAGNVNAIPIVDVLHQLFVGGAVCLLKMNPVNAYVGPLLEKAFAGAMTRGFFEVAYGGPEEGGYLARHPVVDEVHITGSDKTYDAMVWGGTAEERAWRKKSGEKLLTKKVTAELGNIGPWVLVPGPYSDAELRAQAWGLAGMLCHNASFNCLAARLMVLPEGFEGTERFLRHLEEALAVAPTRVPYYPGAEERWRRIVGGRSEVKRVGDAGPGKLPWALVRGLSAADAQEALFRDEPWCAVLSETRLPAPSAEHFLNSAVEFLNGRVWGMLSATLVVHPKSRKDAGFRRALDEAISRLRYGSVCINTWGGTVFGLGAPPWGGHPSATPEDIQSGQGFVHNTWMLNGAEKVLVSAPLRPLVPPPWMVGHRRLHVLGRKLVDFEAAPSWRKVPGLALVARWKWTFL
jgi:aldehyde dehydrogenase (NAD(P)+)